MVGEKEGAGVGASVILEKAPAPQDHEIGRLGCVDQRVDVVVTGRRQRPLGGHGFGRIGEHGHLGTGQLGFDVGQQCVEDQLVADVAMAVVAADESAGRCHRAVSV